MSGAVGLLWTGNWHLCQAAVETVLRGGTLRPISEFLVGAPASPFPITAEVEDNSEVICFPRAAKDESWRKQIGTTMIHSSEFSPPSRFTDCKRIKEEDDYHVRHLDLSLTPPTFIQAPPPQRPGTPSLNSEESAATTVSFESDDYYQPKTLNLFV